MPQDREKDVTLFKNASIWVVPYTGLKKWFFKLGYKFLPFIPFFRPKVSYMVKFTTTFPPTTIFRVRKVSGESWTDQEVYEIKNLWEDNDGTIN